MRQSQGRGGPGPRIPISKVATGLSLAVLLAATVSGATSAAAAPSPGYTASLIPGVTALFVAVDPATDSVYFANDGDEVTVVTGGTDAVATSITLSAGVRGIAVDPATDTVYASLAATATSAPAVAVISGTNNTVTTTIPLPAGSVPAGVAVDSTSDMVYVAEESAAAVAVIDGSLNSVIDTVGTGSGTEPAELAVDESSDVIWVGDLKGHVLAISGTSDSLVQTISVGTEVAYVAADPVSDTVYAAVITGVAVIDGASGTVTTTISATQRLTGVAVDPGSGTVFASSFTGALSTTSVIDPSTNSIVDTIARGGTAVAVDTATGSAYVASGFEPNGAWVLTPSAANELSPIITSASATTFDTGVSDTFTFAASALPAATYTETGALPADITLSQSGILSGTPAAGDAGMYPITITASNGIAPDYSESFTLTVVQLPVITGPSSASFEVGVPGSVPLQVNNGNPPGTTVGIDSDFVSWLSATQNSSGGWQLTGTPPAGSAGLYDPVVLDASNSGGTTYFSISITVQQAPIITSAATTTFLADSNDSYSLSASGYPAPTYAVTAGALPPGVNLFSNGELTEQPGLGLGAVGTYHVTVTATNSAGTSSQPFTLTVRSPLAVGAEGSDGQLWVQAPQLASGWQPLGGKITAAPAVAAIPVIDGSGSTPAGPLFIGTGTNEHLFIRSLTDGWQELGPATAECIGAPAAVITGTATSGYTLTVACRGLNNALFENTAAVPATGLPQFTTGWTSLGGTLSAGPAAAPVGGTITFFVRGTNGQIFTRTATAGYQATPWRCIGGPAASLLAENSTTYFACQGTNRALWYASDTGTGWTAAVSLGGTLIGSPAVVAEGAETVILAEGTNHALFQYPLFGSTPRWTSLGGDINGIAAADLT